MDLHPYPFLGLVRCVQVSISQMTRPKSGDIHLAGREKFYPLNSKIFHRVQRSLPPIFAEFICFIIFTNINDIRIQFAAWV